VISEAELRALDFYLTHRCERYGAHLARFVPAPDGHAPIRASTAPMIYLWLRPVAGGFEPLYVGKAGLGIARRLRQHEQGFRSSSPGRKNLANILALLDNAQPVLVYARMAASDTVLGVRVNLYSVEEEAINERFRPLWNRAQFAGGTRPDAPTDEAV